MAGSTYRMTIRLWLSAILLSFALYVAFTGLQEWQRTRPNDHDLAFPQGRLRIGTDPTYPPFAYDDGQGFAGIDIELGYTLAERIGIEVQFVPISFDGLYDALHNGQVDILISALRPNPMRNNQVRYTQPYFDNGLVLVSDADTPLATMSDLTDRSLAVEYGSLAHSVANNRAQRIAPFELLHYELPQYALDAVRLQVAEGTLVDTITYQLYQRDYAEWTHHVTRVTSNHYAIAVRGDRVVTWDWINATLGELAEDGTLQAIIDRGFERS
ncbi:MAG: ABC transporter substrate-binding protein [Anaerolineae bacterium]